MVFAGRKGGPGGILRRQPQAFGHAALSDWRVDDSAWPPATDGAATDPPSLGPDCDLSRESADSYIIGFGNIARFRVCFLQHSVTVIEAHPETDAATIAHLLNDHVAPRIIARLGALVLHGSAVAIDGRLAIIMGPTGAGKSTLAASLMRRGHRLLGDDAVVVAASEEGWIGTSVYPSLRLYPESISAVLAGTDDVGAMAFYSDKRLVHPGVTGGNASQAVPLGMIFVLADAQEGVSHVRLRPAEACMVIVENSFSFDPRDPAAAADRLARAAALAATVPCVEIAYPYDFSVLDAVCGAVVRLTAGDEAP